MQENKNSRFLNILLSSILFVLITIAIALAIRNLVLKKKFRDLQAPAYIYDTVELAESARQSDPKVIVVLNNDEGAWHKNTGNKVKLIRKLTIGEAEGDTNKMFYRLGPVITDDEGNIYIAEWRDGRIKKFDQDGNYLQSIGRKGAGPGEFFGGLAMTFDFEGNLCVYDNGNQRLSKFAKNGSYLSSIRLPLPEDQKWFLMDPSGCYYFSVYDPLFESVIHKYDVDGTHLLSFGEPVQFKEPLHPRDMTIKRSISGGPIVLFDRHIYFSQMNPYEIRKYTTEGKLVMRVFRKNSFMLPGVKELVGRDTYRYRLPVQSAMIAIWRDKIINWVWIPPYLKSEIKGIIDLFDLDGHLLTSLSTQDQSIPFSMDRQGNIYCKFSTNDGFEQIVKYTLDF